MGYKLLEPITLGKRCMRNRIVLPPLETRQSTKDGDVTNEFIAYYKRRAKGGVGAVIVENTFVDDIAARSSLVSSGLYSDHLIAGKFKVAEAIKSAGALAIIQISHGGRQAGGNAVPGQEALAPSAIACKFNGRMPRELTIEEIIEIEDAFADAAKRAMMAGFDGVEIHGAHGYLICSFLSPYTNKRTDMYGGNAENRARFSRNIIDKIRAITDDNFIVGYRISADEFVEGGLTIKDTTEFVKTVEDKIDYISVSAANYESMAIHMIPSLYIPQGQLVSLASEMKKAVSKCRVITVQALSVELAEKALQENDADIVAFGRALVADPDLPNKLKEGRREDIRPCMRGNEGCMSLFFRGCPIRCEVNPEVGREADYAINKTTGSKNVVVVGGGMAGMEAARVADLYGHKVTLFEKSNILGGHFVEATEPEFKSEAKELLEWSRVQIKKSGVDVLMNTAASKENILAKNPDALIIAVGSSYLRPGIPGVENTITGEEAIMGLKDIGDKVCVIGGGLVGVETAFHLCKQGKKITIIEALAQIVPQDEPLSQIAIADFISKNDIEVLTESTVVRIEKDSLVYVDTKGKEHTVYADTIVAALGLGARKDMVSELENVCSKTYVIGDAVAGRKLYDCNHEAWYAVREISGLE